MPLDMPSAQVPFNTSPENQCAYDARLVDHLLAKQFEHPYTAVKESDSSPSSGFPLWYSEVSGDPRLAKAGEPSFRRQIFS